MTERDSLITVVGRLRLDTLRRRSAHASPRGLRLLDPARHKVQEANAEPDVDLATQRRRSRPS